MVAAVAITRKDYTAEQLRAAAKRTKDAGTARRMLALALVLEGKSRIEAATSAAWTVKFYAIGYIAITLKVSRDFVTEPLPERSRNCLPSRNARWPSWFARARIWPSMVWFAGAGLISRGSSSNATG
jgi:hypothetical protein